MRNLIIALLALLLMLSAGAVVLAAEGEDTPKVTADKLYGDTYTPEELAAIDQALWAANMTRTDMTYKKDYTEGHGCFQMVREMMHDPLTIAVWMDRISAAVGGAAGDSYESIHQAMLSTGNAGAWIGIEQGVRLSFNGADPQSGVDYIESALDHVSIKSVPAERLGQIRLDITETMAWHSFEDSLAATGYESAKSGTQEEIYELLKDVDPLGDEVGHEQSGYAIDMMNLLMALQMVHLDVTDGGFSELTEPYIVMTEIGRVAVGTYGDDYYEGDFAVLIEPGGNDVYRNCRIGAAYGTPTPELGNGQTGYFCDFGGDDFYDCAGVNINLGAAVLGCAAFYDLGGGDDRYFAGSCTLGAAMGGIATFYDDGGSDYYSGKVYTMGAAGFGIGLMVDDSVADAPQFDTAEGNDAAIDNHETGESEIDTHNLMDNDYYTAWSNAQAFARPRGIALCVNRRGNETYHAGGVYLHAPLFSDRYQSFSQGFAIGERGIDWAGGIAMLIDYDGNDRYLGDIYNQGVGYWYGAGLLWDGGGNDTYEMTQYGQGSGIHLAIGGLVDVAGSDAYLMHSGLGQGSSHDLAASILHDRGGNDRYHGNTTCNGGSLTGSVSMHIDRDGDDTYAGRPGNSINYADNRRINIGLLIDTGGGRDEYMGVMADNSVWRHGNIGMGADVAPPPEPEVEEGAEVPAEETAESEIPIPEICSFEGELTQEVFDELWEISVRWEVGDNRIIVPHARDRLVECGPAAVPFMSAVMDNSNSGLALRAYVYIFRKLLEEHSDAVYACLRENAASGESAREQTVLYLIGELELVELEDVVTGFLAHEDPAKVRRAIGVLRSIGSHSADDMLVAMLDPKANTEPVIKTALATLAGLEVDCYGALRPLLSHELISVREELVKQLAAHWDVYGDEVTVDLAAYALGNGEQPAGMSAVAGGLQAWMDQRGVAPASIVDDRAARSLLGILARIDAPPSLEMEQAVALLLGHSEWGLRADAVRVVRHWQAVLAEQEIAASVTMESTVLPILETVLAGETKPYVLFAAEAE